MNDLRTLLETATDRIEAPHLAGPAVAGARRRQLRTRSALAVTAVTATVVLVAGLTRIGSGGTDADPPVDLPTTPVPTTATTQDPTTRGPATQARWDPFDLVEAPVRDSRLPRTPAPPAAPPVLRAVPGVVLAWTEPGADVRLLDVDGTWHTVPDSRDAVRGTLNEVPRPVISADGSRVALSTLDGIRVLDVTTGGDRTYPWPQPIAPPWDTAPTLEWLPGEAGLVVLHWRTTWWFDPGGEARRAPYRGAFVALGIDPAGPVHQNDYVRRRLLTWEGDDVVGDVPFAQCERLTAGYRLLACTAGSLQPFRSGPIVVDPTTGDIVAYAPIQDRNAVYSDNAHLTALGFLDEDSVLLLVGPADFRTGRPEVERWHLVDWDFRTGGFEVLSTGGAAMRDIAVAPGLVG